MSRRRSKGAADLPSVITFHDHELIRPPNKLRKAWTPARPDDQDPVARAEQALAEISTEFAAWMESECARLDQARDAVRRGGFDKATREALFHAAHDIKGEAETFGFPLAAAAADSLCRLIELTPDPKQIPLVLVDQHVDAVRAIVREHDLPHAESMAAALTAELRQLTQEFVGTVNQEGLDELRMASPPTAPPK
jgi:HPt (histidine-containing phosphotransfer) domain-containing protein